MHRVSKEASRSLMHRQRSFGRDMQSTMGCVRPRLLASAAAEVCP